MQSSPLWILIQATIQATVIPGTSLSVAFISCRRNVVRREGGIYLSGQEPPSIYQSKSCPRNLFCSPLDPEINVYIPGARMLNNLQYHRSHCNLIPPHCL